MGGALAWLSNGEGIARIRAGKASDSGVFFPLPRSSVDQASQQTLWEWARLTSENDEVELERPAARGRINLSEIPPAEPEVMVAKIRAARELHGLLERELGAALDLIVTDNRRRMLSIKVRARSTRELRLHHMFLTGDTALFEQVASFVRGDESAREPIRAFIAQHRETIRHEPDALMTLGKYHDLAWILEEMRVFALSFGGGEDVSDVQITWGKKGRGRRSIRLGSFDFGQRLIRIHPALDRRWVPRYFVEFIVYHELLHALYPPIQSEQGGRRVVHTPEFRDMEQRFPHYEAAMAWEQAHIHHFLKSA